MQEEKETKQGLLKTKDPYLKPVLFGGLFITILSLIFAPGIFLWAAIGGYITVRLATKITKEVLTIMEGLLLGVFSGILGGTCLDILTVISFKSPDNQRLLNRTLQKNWPSDLPLPANFNEILPSIFFTTCVFIFIISVIFAAVGGYVGLLISKRKSENKT